MPSSRRSGVATTTVAVSCQTPAAHTVSAHTPTVQIGSPTAATGLLLPYYAKVDGWDHAAFLLSHGNDGSRCSHPIVFGRYLRALLVWDIRCEKRTLRAPRYHLPVGQTHQQLRWYGGVTRDGMTHMSEWLRDILRGKQPDCGHRLYPKRRPGAVPSNRHIVNALHVGVQHVGDREREFIGLRLDGADRRGQGGHLRIQ